MLQLSQLHLMPSSWNLKIQCFTTLRQAKQSHKASFFFLILLPYTILSLARAEYCNKREQNGTQGLLNHSKHSKGIEAFERMGRTKGNSVCWLLVYLFSLVTTMHAHQSYHRGAPGHTDILDKSLSHPCLAAIC